MRFNRLDIIKYGKFSDRTVEFPAAKQDFHLLVGPNEAGKSTLRNAIVDLLFGIPARSTRNFLHPLNELRLGALISNSSGTLEFHRAKANKQTLRSPLDAILTDTALAEFLGTADRHFFEQMFGLDHARLVEGGDSILKAENDVGQILFQSAVGVASLGKIRDELDAEAEKLWAPRKAADRAYYIASAQFEKATAALKEATVRTKDWAAANTKFESLQDALATERDRHLQLQNQRNRLERIRRLAPHLQRIRECESKLAELGELIELPTEAASTLASAEQELALAHERLELRNAELEQLTKELGLVHVDEALLALAADISKLEALYHQYSAHEKDIGHRKTEIATLWQEVCAFCTQLGWTAGSEAAVAQRLPTLLVQRELRQLVRDHGAVVQTLRAAETAENNKQADIALLTKQLASLQSGEINPVLRAALAHAKSLGDSGTQTQKQQATLLKAKTTLDDLLLELGPWQKPVAELMAMQPPSQEKISRLLQDRQGLVANQKSELTRLKAQKAELERIELDIAQFKALHHPTTREDVAQARLKRDTSWQAIKADTSALQQSAEQFEADMRNADQVADRLTDDVEDATALQNLLHQLAREQQNLAAIEAQCSGLAKEIQTVDDNWAQEAIQLHLTDMPLDGIGAWLIKREKVIAAQAAHQEVQHDFDLVCSMEATAKNKLLTSLRDTGLAAADTDSLAVLVAQAESHIQAIDDARARHETLTSQLLAANTHATTLKQDTVTAKIGQSDWNDAWAKALSKAGLAPDGSIGSVEGALELIVQIAEKLDKMRQIQTERIDTMNADLQGFALEAARLAQLIAPELKDEPARQIAQDLATRLSQARKALEQKERLQSDLRLANAQVQEAKESIQTATASLKPLMEKAGVDTHALLSEAIKRSDQQRSLNAELAEAKGVFLNGGDGLTRLKIEAEIDAADLTQLGSVLLQTDAELNEIGLRQNTLSAELADAKRVLSDIGGSDAALQAEAQRQEALAKMAEVAERYVKVYTAGRLLRWSIERYREQKQGPLLSRAGMIFSTLTSGSFQKLLVDFEHEPMVLEGLRSDGKPVGIPGFSDGTRDQLYLALRLAALEMHLEQASPLPFIADDLFINYDDTRSKAGFEALRGLSEQTQVIFLSHHDHLIPTVQDVFGKQVNVMHL
jgi:uncharacterized protein YhaN